MKRWNAGQRNDMDSFLTLTGLGPFYAKETTGGCELDIIPSRVTFSVKGGNHGQDQV